MQKLPFGQIKQFCLLITIYGLFTTACSGESVFSGKALGIGKKSDSSYGTAGDQIGGMEIASVESGAGGLSVTKINNMSFDEIAQVSMLDYYEAGLAAATDEAVDISGQTFVGVKSFLENNRENFQAMADYYPTLGDYFDSVAIRSAADFRSEDIEGGWGVIVQAYYNETLEMPGKAVVAIDLRLQDVSNQVSWENGQPVNNVTIGIGNNIQPGQEIHIDPNAYAALIAPDSFGGQAGAQSVNMFTVNVAPNMPEGSKLILDMPAEGEKNIVFNQGQFSTKMQTDGHEVTWTF